MQWQGKKKYLVVASCCLMLLCAGASSADVRVTETRKKVRAPQEANIVIKNTFDLVDGNNDGKITPTEFVEHVKDFSFQTLDKDKDKLISRGEWNEVESGPEREALFVQCDTNLDGFLTLEEFKDTPSGKETIYNVFRTLDVDGDGVLELEEFDIQEK